MPFIRSIILFNGGSAGDLLKAACLEQIYQRSLHNLDNKGMVNLNHDYFKDFCRDFFHRRVTLSDLIRDRMHTVENTHYYLDIFSEIAMKVFYIDYPDSAQTTIMKAYLGKRFNNNIDLFFKEHFATIPDQFTSKIDCNNIISVCDILWINNLRSWRDKPNLEAIQFKHILNFDLFSAAIEKICQFSLNNKDKLHTTHTNWLESNTMLKNYFKDCQ
jgi:hypothetical protein